MMVRKDALAGKDDGELLTLRHSPNRRAQLPKSHRICCAYLADAHKIENLVQSRTLDGLSVIAAESSSS